MKTLFLNHKYQASYITFIVFIPLLFVIFYSNDFFKMEIKNEDSFSLAIKQFIQTNPTNETKPTESIIEPIKPKPQPKVIKKTPEKIQKKIKKTPPHPIPNKTPIAPTQEVKTFAKTTDTNVKPKITQLTQGKDNHPVLKEIQKAIQQAQFYPRQAKKMRMQGTVKVEFLWKENKTLADLKIIESSGYDLLDKSALESIRKASLNFPYYNGDLRITLPIIYDFKTLRG
ncbi:TPA: TonB family protein [Campylobacter jejuni]|uniref:Energy transducer TonB n=1 Tax=Campylobacter jejuni TaxID=197 RepID=A0A5Y8VUX4_CAMJU|nr:MULTISPECIES: energy transducer TonB [Campylobacter]EAI0804268.1 energy transducer TonB [Campylobacter jejuni]EAJ0635583.1 energy transducer TonB [Campylobacter jejuni]EAJ7835602.1 energy transducer TonB [Campylobacter jejuni]EAJ7869969.1 energy transducer TonB [Campylobacter jejuni]EAJ8383139.1 energy transducer TonB [Campylobacter jejuni]